MNDMKRAKQKQPGKGPQNPRMKRATTAGKSGPTAGKKSKANCRHGTSQYKVQDKDQDENKFKMSVGMDVINCADNTSDKKPTTMTMKGIRGRLNRILATGSDVMCGCSVKEGKLVLRKKNISIYFENNDRVVVNVKGSRDQ